MTSGLFVAGILDCSPAAARLPAAGAGRSVRDAGAEQRQELADPSRVRGPGGRADQIAVRYRAVNRDLGIGPSRQFDVGTTGRIGRAAPAFEYLGAGQQLRAMADRRGFPDR